MNVDRAADAVYRAFQRGAMVLDRRSSEALVRLVIVALGDGDEVRRPEADIKPPEGAEDDEGGLAHDIS